MTDIISIILTVASVLISFMAVACYNEGIEMLVNKNKGWSFFFLLWLGILLFQDGLFSWLPGRFGLELSFFDGLISFEDGAFIHNLGILLFEFTFLIGLALIRYIWHALRKKVKFSGKFFFLDLVFGALCAYAGSRLVQNPEKIDFSADQTAARVVLSVIIVLVLFLIMSGIHMSRKEKKAGK